MRITDTEETPGQMNRQQRADLLASVPKEQVHFFCPVCCSPDEREARDGEMIDVHCGNCGQVFRLVVDLKRIEENS